MGNGFAGRRATAALGARASKSPLPVTVEAGEIGRFPQDIEGAVYFCCLEALQNAAKYAHATQARTCVQTQGGTLRFTVADDGMGYDAPASGTWPTGSPPSAGLRCSPPPARALPSPDTSPSPHARQLGPAHETCHIRARTSRPRQAITDTHATSAQALSCQSAAPGRGDDNLIRMRSVVQVHLGPPRSQPCGRRCGGW
jgi:hypothetical protein